jgi:hypothetical protein
LTCQSLNRLFFFFVNFTTEPLIDLVTFIIYAVAIVTYVPISGGHVGVWAAILPLPWRCMTTSGAARARYDVTLFWIGSPIQPKYKTLTRQKLKIM